MGFIVFKLEHIANDDINHIGFKKFLDANYYFKKFYENRSQSDSNFIKIKYNYEKGAKKPEDRVNLEKNFYQDEVIMSILNNLKITVDSYFDHDSLPNESLVYNFAYLNTLDPHSQGQIINEDELSYYLYRLRRTFKDDYLPSEKMLSVSDNREIIQNYAHSYWGVSLEGVGNIAYRSDNEQSNDYLKNTYYRSVQNLYFSIYILTLHKRYALLYYLGQATKLPQNIDDYFMKNKNANQSEALLVELQERMAMFKLRCMFSEVTKITSQNHFYDLLSDNFRVLKLQDELVSEIEALKSTTEIKEHVVKKCFNDFVSSVGWGFAFVGFFALTNDLTDSLNKFINSYDTLTTTAQSTKIASHLIDIGIPTILIFVLAYVLYSFKNKKPSKPKPNKT